MIHGSIHRKLSMLYRFKSQATSDLVMLEADAKAALRLIGKSPDGPGVIEPNLLSAAIVSLDKAAVEDRVQRAGNAAATGQQSEEADDTDPDVYLSQRLVPLLQMLRLAMEANKAVIWESGPAAN